MVQKGQRFSNQGSLLRSECHNQVGSWILDKQPTSRLLEICAWAHTTQAATGNMSLTHPHILRHMRKNQRQQSRTQSKGLSVCAPHMCVNLAANAYGDGCICGFTSNSMKTSNMLRFSQFWLFFNCFDNFHPWWYNSVISPLQDKKKDTCFGSIAVISCIWRLLWYEFKISCTLFRRGENDLPAAYGLQDVGW